MIVFVPDPELLFGPTSALYARSRLLSSTYLVFPQEREEPEYGVHGKELVFLVGAKGSQTEIHARPFPVGAEFP